MLKTRGISFVSIIILLFAALDCTKVASEENIQPSFLPRYYRPLFEGLIESKNSAKNGVIEFIYNSNNQKFSMAVEYIESERPASLSIMQNIVNSINDEIQNNQGELKNVTKNEIYALVSTDQFEKYILVQALPKSILSWTFAKMPDKDAFIEEKIELIRKFTNRQRYNEAKSIGNVSMGLWGGEIHDYAKNLFETGKKDKGIEVLKKLLQTSPFNYRAHVDSFNKTNDSSAAKNSAHIVLKNAENFDLINEAASFLGVKPKKLEDFPFLESGETGLELILIPLEPCNPWLLERVAEIYQQITGIPVKIRRIKEELVWNAPDRIWNQRLIQSSLTRLLKEKIDFKDWDRDQYKTELLKLSESETAISKYAIKNLILKIDEKEGQYDIDPYLNQFNKTLEKYKPSDDRVMFVGITGANIYSGDNNYVFSLYMESSRSKASIMSYHMMLADTLGEEFQSRDRLVERIAKELVPASLKSLKIPRSTDPTCPYSYSSGIARLDQKSLYLSEPVKKELEKIRSRSISLFNI